MGNISENSLMKALGTVDAPEKPLPRAVADDIHRPEPEGQPDSEPVVVVGVVSLDVRDVETVEREFGGSREHAREAAFDLFGGNHALPSGLSSNAQPAADSPPMLKPDLN